MKIKFLLPAILLITNLTTAQNSWQKTHGPYGGIVT